MKKFDIPVYYRSSVISQIKNFRKLTDPRKKDYSPSVLDFGPVVFLIARHFGFCYGVENAIEIAYKSIEENPDKRVFLLSEMIHNPSVNEDLRQRGVRFIREYSGRQLIDWDELKSEDIVIVPAFGTTLEIYELLRKKGIDPYRYDTTCPFVEKVWNRAEALGKKGFTIVVHGKYKHEETIATFSHSRKNSPTVIVRNIQEASVLADIITGRIPEVKFYEYFKGKYSEGFNVSSDLSRIGVVNQTTMLATETQEISELLKNAMSQRYGPEKVAEHWADTSDTLCYATYDNQYATMGMLEHEADLAIVVGGYNSSNTSHIVELCMEKLPVFFISCADKIISSSSIKHFSIITHEEVITENWMPEKDIVKIMLTSGASCPDAIMDEVLNKIVSFFPGSKSLEDVLNAYVSAQ
ncbi:MAG: 4-hydroxy-3-methylbut-2-enyl diphosphate reductase [Ignavibacteria bacterium]|nr:4-hydroxy-3-methylbut-2-enyl diphosphate reductase [Ignavibacteria bacterium]